MDRGKPADRISTRFSEAFGPHRVMFGSDWPVCLVASKYGQWVEIVSRAVSKLSQDEQARVMGGTAIDAYRLSDTRRIHRCLEL